MEANNLIRITRIEGAEDKFEPSEKLQKGLETYGYMMVLFDEEGTAITEVLSGASTMDIAKYLTEEDGKVSTILKQAMAIAEGLEKAHKIEREYKRKELLDELKESLIKGHD